MKASSTFKQRETLEKAEMGLISTTPSSSSSDSSPSLFLGPSLPPSGQSGVGVTQPGQHLRLFFLPQGSTGRPRDTLSADSWGEGNRQGLLSGVLTGLIVWSS